MNSPILVSIQVGLPQTYGSDAATEDHDRCWTTGFFKQPIAGPVSVTPLGLEGDGQADLRFHGGPDKAVLAYSADHFPKWQQELPQVPWSGGAFGENLTIAGLDEHQVCIGDIFAIGSVRLEVSQPRRPCWKLSRRWQIDDLTRRVTGNGRSGWYHRVLDPGEIAPGQSVEIVSHPHPEWSIHRAQQLMYFEIDNLADAAALATVPALAATWRDAFQERIAKRA